MATFKSDEVTLLAPAQRVYDRLSDLGSLRSLLDSVPAQSVPDDKKQMFENIVITDDTLTIPTGAAPMGNLTLRKEGCIDPTLIRLTGVGTPVPLSMALAINPEGDDACTARVIVDIEIPMLLKPMVSGPLNKLVEQIAQVLPRISFGE